MRLIKRIFGIFCGLFCWATLQAGNGWFTYAPYGKSLLSDDHPNFVRFEIIGHTNNEIYDFGHSGESFRLSTLGCLGIDLPVWSGNFGAESKYGLSFTIATSDYLWIDMLEPMTKPVINTDYRIGLPTATFIHRLNHKFLKNYSVAFSPYKHESTHIGDELQIQRIDEDYALRRANVTYHYTELAFTMNEPEDRSVQCHTFRVGLMVLLMPESGWYRIKTSAGDGDASLAHPTNSPYEAYFQYQYQTATTRRGFQGVISAEIRNRVVYGYDLTLKNGDIDNSPSDYRRFTYNLFLGMRYNIPGYEGYFGSFSVGARLYHGNCPFGQFRSIDDYTQVGLVFVFQ